MPFAYKERRGNSQEQQFKTDDETNVRGNNLGGMTVFTTYSQNGSTRGPDSQSHENEVNESLSPLYPKVFGKKPEAEVVL